MEMSEKSVKDPARLSNVVFLNSILTFNVTPHTTDVIPCYFSALSILKCVNAKDGTRITFLG